MIFWFGGLYLFKYIVIAILSRMYIIEVDRVNAASVTARVLPSYVVRHQGNLLTTTEKEEVIFADSIKSQRQISIITY